MCRLKKEWYKVLFICFTKLFSMLIFQRVVGGWLLGEMLHLLPGGPPNFNFIFRISILTSITGCLFTFAYLIIGDKLSINGSVKRGVIFGMFIYFSNYLPQSMGLIGAGGDNVIMSFSAKDAVFDFFSYIVTFSVMGWLFKTDNNKQKQVPRVHIMKAVITGGLLFPIIIIVLTQGITYLFPSQNIINILHISSEFELRFYLSFYSFFILTGALVTLLYYLSDFNRNTTHKKVKFAIKYAVLIWIPIVFAMVVFGVEIQPCIVFSLESIVAFLILTYVIGRILEKNIIED